MKSIPRSDAVKLNPQGANVAVWKDSFNLPNVLTFSRILLVPVFIVLFSTPTPERSLAAALVFGIAALTDLLDGYVARRRAQVTTIGRLLDPIADKLLVITGLVMLVQLQRVEAWLAIVMIAREVGVTGMRVIAAREGIIVAAGVLGKYKVVLQIIGILFLVVQGAHLTSIIDFLTWGTVFLYLALVCSLLSGGQYFMEIWRQLRAKGFFEYRLF